jgi:FtsZ-interacting cell division protein ZipA
VLEVIIITIIIITIIIVTIIIIIIGHQHRKAIQQRFQQTVYSSLKLKKIDKDLVKNDDDDDDDDNDNDNDNDNEENKLIADSIQEEENVNITSPKKLQWPKPYCDDFSWYHHHHHHHHHILLHHHHHYHYHYHQWIQSSKFKF